MLAKRKGTVSISEKLEERGPWGIFSFCQGKIFHSIIGTSFLFVFMFVFIRFISWVMRWVRDIYLGESIWSFESLFLCVSALPGWYMQTVDTGDNVIYNII